MKNARGTFLRSERPDGEPWRVRIGVPEARPVRDDDTRCELPAPTDQGRVYNPPHPIFAIAFVYAVSIGLLWGATSGAGAASPRFAVTFAALVVCLLAAVHWLEGVQASHLAAKLGAVRAPACAWWVAGVAALPGLAWCVGGGALRQAGPGNAWPSLVLGALALAAASIWTEAFFRGFAFRALMRRHGFLFSAAVSSVLGGAILPFVLALRAGSAPTILSIACELPLGFALCALFAMSGMSLGPGLCVRASVLAAAWWAASAWPALVGAVIVLVLVRATDARRAREA